MRFKNLRILRLNNMITQTTPYLQLLRESSLCLEELAVCTSHSNPLASDLSDQSTCLSKTLLRLDVHFTSDFGYDPILSILAVNRTLTSVILRMDLSRRASRTPTQDQICELSVSTVIQRLDLSCRLVFLSGLDHQSSAPKRCKNGSELAVKYRCSTGVVIDRDSLLRIFEFAASEVPRHVAVETDR